MQALRAQLTEVVVGRAFLLQDGDCAESFDASNGEAARETFCVMLQMAVVLTYGAVRPVIKVSRIAGPYAKLHSADTETQGDITLPSYRGNIINGAEFTAQAHAPQSERLRTVALPTCIGYMVEWQTLSTPTRKASATKRWQTALVKHWLS